jgi:hypothetical protein
MIRNLALSFILTVTAFTVCKTSFAINYVDNGTATNYDLNPGDSLYVASGTYTGNITDFASGARITVANGATFTPGSMPHNANGTIHNYGIFTYTSSWTVNTNFKVNNYAGGIMTLGSITIRGNSQTWTNYIGGIITFAEVLMNGNDDDLNNIMINYDSVRCDGNFQMNGGSAFTNFKDFSVGGTLRVNGGTLINEGNLLTGTILMNNGASVIRNYCRMQATGGITNTSGNFYNYSYLWAVNSDITNSANIINSSVANSSSAPNFATTPMIHGRNYTHTGGTMTGPALLYFYGTTLISGGTIGVTGVTTDTIKMYDITRLSPLTIFDNQAANTLRPNVIYNAWGVPDSNRVYLLGCSMEVVLESPLAVNWRSFDVLLLNTNIPLLVWTAEFDGQTIFEIERSYDGRHFSKIDQVDAIDGKKDYRYSDKYVNNQAPVAYYRIKAVETVNSIKFSQIRMVRFANAATATKVVPNPFKNNFNIIYTVTEAGNVIIRVFNVNGQQKVIRRVTVNKGSNNINIVEAAQFANGIYIVQVSSADAVFSTRLVKQ